MSGDVQPRKRKDKKKKKDELGLEEPRGTAAALGEGDVFMHSYNDHGTGGHWCAKVIFFSLLAVLVTLIGLIILENRGLSELEANAVESKYSNILEGWLEDAPDDDHHDEHTLELKHHDDEEDDHYESHNADDHDDDHELDDDEDEAHHEEEETEEDEENQEEDEQDDEHDIEEADEDEDERQPYRYYTQDDDDDDEEKADNDEEEEADDDDDEGADDDDETAQDNEEIDQEETNEELEDNDESDDNRDEDLDDEQNKENDDDEEEENQTKEEEDGHEDHEEEADEDDEVEVEHIEREASEEQEPISTELPALPEEDDDETDANKDDDLEDSTDADDVDSVDNDADDGPDDDAADDDFLEADDELPAEPVTAPAGKPFIEVQEDDVSTESPPDTLEEEEEYEKQQEELRKEEEQSSHHMWLKLSVGGALLAATHAVLRRATAPRDEPEEQREEREETPLIDRRMTLIPPQAALPVLTKKVSEPVVEEIVKREAPVVKAPPVVTQDSEEEEEDEEPEVEEVAEEEIEEIDEPETLEAPAQETEKQELYSDEEEEEEEEVIVPKKETPKAAKPAEPEPEDDMPDDVEIIDDEQIEEELEEEEEVSDVDDTELLSRLEAKYGRLPEPERPPPRHKDGGNSVADDWPGEPADAYWRQQLDSAERDLRQGAWSTALERADSAELRASARARYIAATALDRLAEEKRDNALLSRAISAYFRLLEMSDQLSDKKLVQVASRAIDRIQFRGSYIKAEPVYRLLIRRFPDEPLYRNNMTITYLMSNRNDLAENVLKETLARWPDDRVALAHYAFILKTGHKDRLEEAAELFRRALDGDAGPACEPRFYYHYGDALLLLNRFKEAHEVHSRGARLGHFLSAAQRSLYNVPRLRSQPWWDVEDTPYRDLARSLEDNWREILKEGQKAAELFQEEQEGLRSRGEWSQLDLWVRGREVGGRCERAPLTCRLLRAAGGGVRCARGQVKFSAMSAGTHVRAHTGPTNCRLRMHLALANTTHTYLRVHQHTRQWQEGKVLMFDDSFEHEVWHNGTGTRLVLIVDVWHPDLTPAERRTLPPI